MTGTTLAAPPALVLDLLDWVAVRPRSYAEAMDAWRTSCPRLPVWEDAREAGLISIGAAPARLICMTAAGEQRRQARRCVAAGEA